MRWKSKLATAVTIAAMPLSSNSPSSAATEAGGTCAANETISGLTLVQTAAGTGSSLPFAIPSVGVLTKWRITLGEGAPLPIQAQLKILRRDGAVDQLEVVAEDSSGPLAKGENSIDTRLPVKTGDLIGLYGSPNGTPYCEVTDTASRVGVLLGNPKFGSTVSFDEEKTKTQLPVRTVIEADVDSDGYGDETQDGCPQSRLYHTGCPTVSLSATANVGGRIVTVRVKSTSEAPVHVFGRVSWRTRQETKRRTHRITRLTALLSGGTRTVEPGNQATRFTVSLPRPVLRRLRQMNPREALTAKLAARATDLAGRVTGTSLRVKLPGRNHGRKQMPPQRVRSRAVATLRG